MSFLAPPSQPLDRVTMQAGYGPVRAHAIAPGLVPGDRHDETLLRHVRPADWRNPEPATRYDLVVVGAGTAGLVSAAVATGLGARVALVERSLMGGDCLNHGCVPSKALIRSARAAAECRQVGALGVRLSSVEVDGVAVLERLRRLRAGIASHDSAERFTELGVDVFLGPGRFVARDALDVDGRRLAFKRAVIATGARAAVPPIDGLTGVEYMTNETLFGLTDVPASLLVLGGGPIGCEMAQAFARLGTRVTVVDVAERVLPRDDADASRLIGARLAAEGVELRLGAFVQQVSRAEDGQVVMSVEKGGVVSGLVAQRLLVATGRAPNVENLGLEQAGVAFGRSGVEVDGRLRTTNTRVFAAGDVCSRFKFTHAADAMARLAVRNALFPGSSRADRLVIPWCTYTDPEVAHVGITADEAEAAGARVLTLTVDLGEVDRAVLDGEPEGFARVHVDRRSGRLLGATMVSRHAGESLGTVALTVTRGLSVSALDATIHPYPTQAEAWKRLGTQYLRTRLKPWMKPVLAWWMRVLR